MFVLYSKSIKKNSYVDFYNKILSNLFQSLKTIDLYGYKTVS